MGGLSILSTAKALFWSRKWSYRDIFFGWFCAWSKVLEANFLSFRAEKAPRAGHDMSATERLMDSLTALSKLTEVDYGVRKRRPSALFLKGGFNRLVLKSGCQETIIAISHVWKMVTAEWSHGWHSGSVFGEVRCFASLVNEPELKCRFFTCSCIKQGHSPSPGRSSRIREEKIWQAEASVSLFQSSFVSFFFLLDGPFPVSDTGQHVMDPTSRPFPVAGCTRRSRRNGKHREIKAGYLTPNRIKLCPLLPNICLCTPSPRSHKLHKLAVCKEWVLTWTGRHQICWKCLKINQKQVNKQINKPINMASWNF